MKPYISVFAENYNASTIAWNANLYGTVVMKKVPICSRYDMIG